MDVPGSSGIFQGNPNSMRRLSIKQDSVAEASLRIGIYRPPRRRSNGAAWPDRAFSDLGHFPNAPIGVGRFSLTTSSFAKDGRGDFRNPLIFNGRGERI